MQRQGSVAEQALIRDLEVSHWPEGQLVIKVAGSMLLLGFLPARSPSVPDQSSHHHVIPISDGSTWL